MLRNTLNSHFDTQEHNPWHLPLNDRLPLPSLRP